MMMTQTNQYMPDYAVPPGLILEERLEAQNMSQAELARRCGRSPEMISEIIAGNAPIEPKIALQLEKALGMDASVWLGIEADYRLRQERENEARHDEKLAAWAKGFPVNELVKRGTINKPSSSSDMVSSLLSFFGVASVEAWQNSQKKKQLAYRHSPSFESDEFALAAWLRLGEIEASSTECVDYRETTFKQSLRRIRTLTARRSDEVFDEAVRLCSEAGVALTIIKPLPKTAINGASWWLTPRKSVIQLSARHMSDDQLWFSLFHEAAHILLHSKNSVFIRDQKYDDTDVEIEANRWAADFLVSPRDWNGFINSSKFTKSSIIRFADEQGIAPGIIVGRLQHEGHLTWETKLNGLKTRLKWG